MSRSTALSVLAATLGLFAAAAAAQTRAEFENRWMEHGVALRAEKPWLADRRVLVLLDGGVPAEIAPQIATAVRAQLDELGSEHFSVDSDSSSALRPCIQADVLDLVCFGEAIDRIRSSPGPAARSILLLVTNAALGSLPRPLADGSGTEGPPSGQASYPEGWAIVSEYYRIKNAPKAPGATSPTGLTYRIALEFADFDRAYTAKHELVHLLGLPHHELVPNPGFPEPPEGEACRHKVGGPPGPECLMRCGSGDDAWAHRQTYGQAFGLCQRCAAAARAVVKGIER